MAVSPWVGYVGVAILLLLVVGIFILFFVILGSYNNCVASESPYCPLLYCQDPTTACGNYPWRPDPVTGAPICSQYLLTMTAPTAGPKTTA
jgi:hypothetical protein